MASEKDDAIRLAHKVLDEPYRDPDDDLSMMSRQFLRSLEVVEKLKADLAASLDPTGDLIAANRDAILKMHEEAIRRIADAAQTGRPDLIMPIIRALWTFHPMHGESWRGWPEGTG